MAAASEFFVLALMALNKWTNYEVEEQELITFETTTDIGSTTESRLESKSLYDLMDNFPKAEDIECPESDSRFRYPGECSRYVTCRKYEAHIRSCPPGMSFDTHSGQCRLAFEVDCQNDLPTFSMCDEDEAYSKCGTSCERTCDNFRDQIECELRCVEGCFCRLGYVRDDGDNCVKPEYCENANSLFSVFRS